MQGCKESGRSMIEMLGVLAIIGVLSAGGIAGYSSAMESHKVNKTVYAMTYAAVRSEEILKKTEFDGVNRLFYRPNVLCELHALPEEICNAKVESDDKRRGYFGETIAMSTSVNVADKTITALDGEELTIYAPFVSFNWDFREKIPVSACVKIVTNAGWSSAGKIAITFHLGGEDGKYELPLDVSTAVTKCTAEYEGESYSWGVNIVLEADAIE